MTRTITACACAAALVVGGCGGAGHTQTRATTVTSSPVKPPYSSQVRSAWLHTCEAAANGARGARARCVCTLAYLEAHVSQATLEASQKQVLRGEASEPAWMLDAATACLNT
jgi:hypothetical protein